MTFRGTNAPSRQTGLTTILLTPTIATSGRLMIGVETMPPSAPSEVSVIVEPESSSAAKAPPLAHPSHFARAFVQTESLGVADNGNHEAVRRLRRHAQVDGAEARDDVVFIIVMSIDLRELGDRLDDPEDKERQQGQLRSLFTGAGVE